MWLVVRLKMPCCSNQGVLGGCGGGGGLMIFCFPLQNIKTRHKIKHSEMGQEHLIKTVTFMASRCENHEAV